LSEDNKQTCFSLNELNRLLVENATVGCPGMGCGGIAAGIPTPVVVNDIGIIFITDEDGQRGEAKLILFDLLHQDDDHRSMVAACYLKQHPKLLSRREQTKFNDFWQGKEETWQAVVERMISQHKTTE